MDVFETACYKRLRNGIDHMSIMRVICYKQPVSIRLSHNLLPYNLLRQYYCLIDHLGNFDSHKYGVITSDGNHSFWYKQKTFDQHFKIVEKIQDPIVSK